MISWPSGGFEPSSWFSSDPGDGAAGCAFAIESPIVPIVQDAQVVLAALRGIRRRLEVNRSLAELAWATSLLLCLVLALQISTYLAPLQAPARGVLQALFFAAWAGWLAWKLTRRESLARAAGVADLRGGLKDALKTALWFISRGEASPWVHHQIRRAAATATELDPKALVPITFPRAAPFALGLLAAVGLLAWLAPRPQAPAVGSVEPLSEDESAKLEDIRSLLRDPDGQGEEENPQAKALEKLEQTFRLWERGEISREDALRKLQKAQDALAERELDSAALREELARVGNALKGAAELSALAEALKKAKLAEAADLLRSLAEKPSEREAGAKLQELLDRLARSPSSRGSDLDQLLAKLKEAAEAAKNDPERARESLQAAAASLDSMATAMTGEMRLGEAGRQLHLLGGMMEARQAAEAAERLSGPGEPGDSTTGPPGGSAEAGPHPGEATRLEVQLEMEKLASQKRAPEPEPEEISHEPTREKRSQLAYRERAETSPYARAEPMSAEPIPWRYRRLVKDYFLTLRPSAEK